MTVTVCHCPACSRKISLKTISISEAAAERARALEEGAKKCSFFQDAADEIRAIARRLSRPIRVDKHGMPLPGEITNDQFPMTNGRAA